MFDDAAFDHRNHFFNNFFAFLWIFLLFLIPSVSHKAAVVAIFIDILHFRAEPIIEGINNIEYGYFENLIRKAGVSWVVLLDILCNKPPLAFIDLLLKFFLFDHLWIVAWVRIPV